MTQGLMLYLCRTTDTNAAALQAAFNVNTIVTSLLQQRWCPHRLQLLLDWPTASAHCLYFTTDSLLPLNAFTLLLETGVPARR